MQELQRSDLREPSLSMCVRTLSLRIVRTQSATMRT